MIVLALDTAGADCSAALYDSDAGRVLASVTETIGKGHAERLMDIIDRALGEAGLEISAVQHVAVTIGPGSFTGVRVGVSTARGLALALGVAAQGVTTLAVLAAAARGADGDAERIVAIDARRGEVYFQHFAADGAPLGEPLLLTVDAARALVEKAGCAVTGSAAPLLREGVAATGGDRYPAEIVARLGVSGESLSPKPLYLRDADAKPQMGFAVARR